MAEMIPITTKGRTSISDPFKTFILINPVIVDEVSLETHQVVDEWNHCETETAEVSSESDANPSDFSWVQLASKGIEYEKTGCYGKLGDEIERQGLVHSV